MSHRRTPSQSRGHSRMKSDDYKLLLDSDDNPTFHLEQQIDERISLEEPLPVLIQPKFQYVSLVNVVLRSTVCLLAAIFGRRSWVHLFTSPVASIVVLSLAVAIPVSLGLSSYFVYHPRIDKSLQSFETPNHIATERRDAFEEAVKATRNLDLHSIASRGRRSLSFGYKSYPDSWAKSFPGLKTPSPSKKTVDPEEYRQTYPRGSLDLVYLAIGDEDANIFTKERLLTIHRVEQLMMKHKGFADFCWRAPLVRQDPILNDRFNACTPPISLNDFFFPSNNKYFDGQGHENLTETSIQDTLTFLLSKEFTFWFVDDHFSETNRKSRFLRAQLKLGFPLSGFPVRGSPEAVEIQSKRRKEFIISYIKELEKASTDKLQVLYGGTTIFDYEVKSALNSDVTLACFTLLAVALLLLVLTFSAFLMFCGIISIALSIPLALSILLYVFRIKSLGILSAVSLFVIIGIGVDDVFVFINTFRQAKYTDNLNQRMRYTVLTAGKATFFTSFTTAAAFAANCLSQMPAVHDFGLFMALIVSACWLTVLFTIPPALNLWYRYIAKWEAKLHFSISSNPNRFSSLPESVMYFLSGNGNTAQRQQETIPLQELPSDTTVAPGEEETNGQVQGTDGDEVLLQMPDENDNPAASDDEDLLQMPEEVESTSPLIPAQNLSSETAQNSVNEGLTCGSRIQEFLFHFLALPILKGRYVVLVFFLAILSSSLYLNTQIKTSQKPPQFFKKSTNLQQFVDLQFNTSSDNMDCVICNDMINTGNDIWTENNKPAQTIPPTENHPGPVKGNEPNNDDEISEKTTSLTKEATTPASQNPTTAPDASSIEIPQSQLKSVLTSQVSSSPTSASLQVVSSPTSVSSVRSTKEKVTKATIRSATTPVPQANVENPTVLHRTSTQLKTTDRRLQDPVQQKPTTFPRTSTQLKTTEEDNGIIENNNNINVVPTTASSELCARKDACKPVEKPILATTAVVYVVFGVKGINRTGVDETHVLKSKGKAVFDDVFSSMITNSATRGEVLTTLCEICKRLAKNRELVKPAGADCFPYVEGMERLAQLLHTDGCQNLPKPNFLAGAKSRSSLRMKRSSSNFSFVIAMAFESTTYKGKSSTEMYKDYKKWEKALSDLTKDKPAAFRSAFQTSKEWVTMFREIIAVNSAVYGMVLSMCLCVAAVVIFTGHFMLAVIVMLTILCVLSTVVAIFYLKGWHLGVVEAISLSILVGTSVDYCVHLVEGYILAGNAVPDLPTNKERRRWRASAAVAHIGTSLLSSALTTIFAAIPLCFTTIQLFAKFGEIVAINTGASIMYTFTVCVAMLGLMGPAKFRYSWRSFLIAFGGTFLFSLVATLTLYLVSIKIKPIPGPSGSALFSSEKHHDFLITE